MTLQYMCVWTLACFGSVEQQMVSVQRFLNLKQVVQEEDKFEITPPENWPHEGNIEFRDVTLKYRPTTDAVLKKLNF